MPKDSLKVGGPHHAHPAPHAPCLKQRCERKPPRAVAQILDVEPGTLPQIPHADDTCNRELFIVAHLRSGQARSPSQPACVPRHRCSGLTPRTCPRQAQTECAAYKRDADYPVDPALQAECSLCERWLTVPDVPARRRDHCLATFSCATLGASAGPRVPRWPRWPNAPGRRSRLACGSAALAVPRTTGQAQDHASTTAS